MINDSSIGRRGHHQESRSDYTANAACFDKEVLVGIDVERCEGRSEYSSRRAGKEAIDQVTYLDQLSALRVRHGSRGAVAAFLGKSRDNVVRSFGLFHTISADQTSQVGHHVLP